MRDEGVRHALKDTDAMDGPAHVRDNQLFWLGDEGRVGIVKGEEHGETASWRAGQHAFLEPAQGWEAWAAHEAARCSPGVLLRPLYQEMLLESACVILGPGEWMYWHQLPRHSAPMRCRFSVALARPWLGDVSRIGLVRLASA